MGFVGGTIGLWLLRTISPRGKSMGEGVSHSLTRELFTSTVQYRLVLTQSN
jgi:hypothetical protein